MDVGQWPDGDMVPIHVLKADFCRVVARWRLTQAEVRSLLGQELLPAGEVAPGGLGGGAARRAGLLVAVDRGLAVLLPDLDRLHAWLRSPSKPFAGRTPLEAMADLEALVALAKVAGLRPMAPGPGGGCRS